MQKLRSLSGPKIGVKCADIAAQPIPAYGYGMNYREHIEMVPGRRSGTPVIKGTRLAVADILDCFASGMSEKDILADFDYISRDDIRACLAFAAARENMIDLAQAS